MLLNQRPASREDDECCRDHSDFPDDLNETTDTDGDGVGDNGDDFPDDLESVDDFLPALGRTHPSGVAGPKGVLEIDNPGALFERA